MWNRVVMISSRVMITSILYMVICCLVNVKQSRIKGVIFVCKGGTYIRRGASLSPGPGTPFPMPGAVGLLIRG